MRTKHHVRLVRFRTSQRQEMAMDELERQENLHNLPGPYRSLAQEHSRVWQAYEALGKAAAEEGPLDLKSRELIKLGMAAGAGSMSAVQSHTHRALHAGATPEEVEHTLLLGVTTLGWPTTMAAYTWAKVALEDHTRGERIGSEGDDRGSPWPR
ncbi:MAG TPA: carboxymuconolactone decarboxylase family protein [Chloroflexia bacterium]|nr:carboxymuconolactone decarboxylase family protein [Chloroflexia bacterium]